MYSIYTTGARQNPNTLWGGREIHALSSKQKKQIARALADTESKVWSEIHDGSHSDYSTILETLMHHKDVIIAVSYENEGEEFTGPYLSYFMAYEIDPDEGIHDDEIGALEEIAGISFDDFLREVPSGKVFFVEDFSRLPTRKAIVENLKMSRAVLAYLKEIGAGFAADARSSTSYRLFKSPFLRSVFVKLDHRIPNYYGPGDDAHTLIGYFRKSV